MTSALADYPRDLVGYGATPPDPKWPGGARVALQFVLNYEEGSEPSIADGDGYTVGDAVTICAGSSAPTGADALPAVPGKKTGWNAFPC